jgi:hypothetical protein
MLSAIAFAWPQPAAVLLLSTLNFLILSYAAFRQPAERLHWPALGCLAISYLTAFHRLLGHDLGEAFLSSQSGVASAGLFLGIQAGAELLCRLSARSHARVYSWAGGAVALVGMALVTVAQRGIDDPVTALVVYGVCGVGTLAVNARWRVPFLSSLGLALIVAATLWALYWYMPQQPGPWGIALALEALTFAALAALAARFGRPSFRETFGEALARTAEATIAIALFSAARPALAIGTWTPEQVCVVGCATVLWIVLALAERRAWAARSVSGTAVLIVPVLVLVMAANASCACVCLLWLSFLWMADARIHTNRRLFLASQIVLVAAVLTGTAGWLTASRGSESLLEPHCLQTFGIGLGVLSLLCTAVRTAAARRPIGQMLLAPGWAGVDQWLLPLLLAAHALLLTVAFGLQLAVAETARHWTAEIGSPLGWLALLVALAAAALYALRQHIRPTPGIMAAVSLAVLVMLGGSAARWSADAGARTVLLGCPALALAWVLADRRYGKCHSPATLLTTLAAAIVIAYGFRECIHPHLGVSAAAALALFLVAEAVAARRSRAMYRGAVGVIVLAAGLALREVFGNGATFAPVCLTIILWLLSVALAMRAEGVIYHFTAGLLGCLAGLACWAAWLPRTLESLALVQVVSLTVNAIAWVVLCRTALRGQPPEPPGGWPGRAERFARASARIAVLLFAGTAVCRLILLGAETPRAATPAALPCLAWAALAGAFACQRWWRRSERTGHPRVSGPPPRKQPPKRRGKRKVIKLESPTRRFYGKAS